jgi:nucleoid-associated protein
MAIKNIIVHLLNKKADSGESTLSLSDEVISTTHSLDKFLDDLNKTYNSKSNKIFGAFRKDQELPSLKQCLSDYIEKQTGFVDMSHQAMMLFKQSIDQANKATGGYVVFIHYALFGTEFMMIAILNNTGGISVSKSLDISNIDYLDLSKLHLAARIDLTQWKEEPDSDRFISMVRAKESHKLSEYFRNFIGSDEKVDSGSETAALFNAVNQYCDDEISEDNDKALIKKKAAKFCIEQADNGQNIALNDFSSYVNDTAVDDFLNYVKNEQFELASEIAPNKSVARRFNKLSGRNARLSISFNEEMLGNDVVFNAEKGTLTFSDIPDSLKSQLINRN